MTILIFIIEVTSDDKDSRRAYFILNKENEEMIQILEGNQRIITEISCDVDLLIGLNEETGEIETKSISLDQLSKYIVSNNDYKSI